MPVKTCTNSSPDNSARKDLEMKPVDMRRAILDRGNICTSYATLRFPQLGKKQVFLILFPPNIRYPTNWERMGNVSPPASWEEIIAEYSYRSIAKDVPALWPPNSQRHSQHRCFVMTWPSPLRGTIFPRSFSLEKAAYQCSKKSILTKFAARKGEILNNF